MGFKNAVTFIAGCAVGAIGMYLHLNEKCDKIIAETKAYFNQKLDDATNNVSEPEPIVNPKKTFKTESSVSGKTNYSAISSGNTYEKVVKDIPDSNAPTILSPEEFTTQTLGEDVDVQSWLYFSDGVLTDEDCVIIDRDSEIREIGPNAVHSFGDYEDDAVYVYNPSYDTYYEVLADNRNYNDEVAHSMPNDINF